MVGPSREREGLVVGKGPWGSFEAAAILYF